jgi:DNA-binding ferritin-like protein (Dps family)
MKLSAKELAKYDRAMAQIEKDYLFGDDARFALNLACLIIQKTFAVILEDPSIDEEETKDVIIDNVTNSLDALLRQHDEI